MVVIGPPTFLVCGHVDLESVGTVAEGVINAFACQHTMCDEIEGPTRRHSSVDRAAVDGDAVCEAIAICRLDG